MVIGTPGRIADHLRRKTLDLNQCHTLVLDEFDKSLEIGFEDDMEDILKRLKGLETKILTSATELKNIPKFVGLKNSSTLNYLREKIEKLSISVIRSPIKDKLATLVESICHLGDRRGIVFCNYRDSVERVSHYLSNHGIQHTCYHGGLEQMEREQALIKFRNGTSYILLATDLAARGLDIPELHYIIHYHLPLSEQEFTHRNGRTARMKEEGTAYVLAWEEDELPDFISFGSTLKLEPSPIPKPSPWKTMYISGGRKDKISKGDIAGLLAKTGGVEFGSIGVIELKGDCAFVAVNVNNMKSLINKINNTRLKRKKVRVRVLD